MNWGAKWIWDKSGEHPRNYWVCFRKEIDIDDGYDEAKLHITADSRYIVYLNGKKVGFGPARYWDFERSYDTYDITDSLVQGRNCIAVLAVHYGVSTFQYVEGRGGLLAQIELISNDSTTLAAVSDETWKSKVHGGYLKDTLKINAQQAWAEVFDANKFDSGWAYINYDNNEWDKSVELGGYDMKPWGKLIPRDIPFLTSEKVYPERVESYREVLPVRKSISINLRNALFYNEYSANPKEFTANLCLNIYSAKMVTGNIVFPFTAWQSPRGNIKINGRGYILGKDGEAHGTLQDDGFKLEVDLNEGYNLFSMDISGTYHEFGVTIAFDFESDIQFADFNGYEGSRCLIIGPFDVKEKYDTGYGKNEGVNYEDPVYRSCWEISNFKDVLNYSGYIKPVAGEHILENTAYPLSTIKKVLLERPVTAELQNIATANNSFAAINPPNAGDIELIIDFGRELTGFIGFDICTSEEAVFDFYMFEYLNNGVIENTKDLDNTLRYISLKGKQRYESPVRRGFRYAMLTIRNLRKPCKIYSVYANLSTYPVANVGRFECSDYKLNKIWEMSRYTTRLCMEDTFVDCPAYEQTFWVGDSRNEALVNYYTFGSYDIVRRCLNLAHRSAQITGFLMDQVPSGWQSIIPDWTFFWVTACKEYYEYSRDFDFIKEVYPHLLKVLAEYEKLIDDKGLFQFCGWNLLDWAPMDTPDSGVITHQNAAFAKALRDTAYVASLVVDKKEEKRLITAADRLKRAINLYLWSEEKKAYIDCIHENGERSEIASQQTNTMVYLYDCYDEGRESYITDLLLNCPDNFVKIGSPFMSFFYLEALMKMGKANAAVDYIRQWWGMMLDYGATTCWETFPGFEKGRLTRSHCHAWSAAPGYFLGAYILGVKFEKPGFEGVIVEPNPCGLQWAKGSVPVPDGRIDVEWEIAGRNLNIKIKTLESCSINLVLDKERWGVNEVYLNGNRVE